MNLSDNIFVDHLKQPFLDLAKDRVASVRYLIYVTIE